MTKVSANVFYFFWGVLVIAGLGLLSSGCSQSNTEWKGELRPVKIGITPSLTETATYVAKERGYFEKNGLEVTLTPSLSGSAALYDLLNGTVQIAHVTEAPVIYALMDSSYYPGIPTPPFRIFADMVYSNKTQKIVARKDHGITEPLDIVGKKVALLKGTHLDYFFDSFLLEHQIYEDEFEILNMNLSEQMDAIKNGEIDVAVMWEPYASYTYDELGDSAVFLDTELTYSTLWLSAALDSYAESNPEILVSYLEAIEDAQEYIREHPDYAQQLLSSRTDVPVHVIESLWNEIDYELSLSERMLTLLENQARWMIRSNVADTSVQNMQQLINFSPMQEVQPRGITVIK